jgi:hypothetical protein
MTAVLLPVAPLAQAWPGPMAATPSSTLPVRCGLGALTRAAIAAAGLR